MTAAARRVLGDCEAALNMLEDEEDEQRWRVLWAGAMALLRTVGHVLRNVDRTDASVRRAVDAAWGRWKAVRSSNAVFWEFIEEERNNILKEYRFSVLDSAEVGLVVVARSDSVEYIDPYDAGLRLSDNPTLDLFFSKHFRYWYQQEYRFVWIPSTCMPNNLDPFQIELGSLSKIAEFVDLQHNQLPSTRYTE